MKIKTGIIAILFIVILFCCACAGKNDWRFELINGYEIWRVNSNEIVCGKRNSEHSLGENVGEKFVSEFCYDNRYVCLQCADKTRETQINYYIIDTSIDAEYGPYTQNEFENKLKELNITQLCSWIKTNPRPDGAKFD